MSPRLFSNSAGVTTSLLVLAASGCLEAQGTFQAISFSPPGVLGYTPTNGVGWSFVPSSDLLVTAVSSSAPEINFWQGTNQIIATYGYTGAVGSIPGGPSTNFQTVPFLFLSAGQTYFISTQSSSFTSEVDFFIFGLNGTGGLRPFTVSPYINQVASYYVSPSGQWSPTTTPASENINYLFLGPNFQFQVVPEPACLELFILAGSVSCFRRAGRRILHSTRVKRWVSEGNRA